MPIRLFARLSVQEIEQGAGVGGVEAVGIAVEELAQRRRRRVHPDTRPDRLVGLRLVQVVFRHHRDRQLRRLAAVGRRVDVAAYPPEHGADLEPRLLDLLEERRGKRTVAPGPVTRHVVGLGRIDDDHPLRLFRRRIALNFRHVTGRDADRTNKLLRQRIVAARVENHDLDAAGKLHGRLDIVETHEFVAKADLVLQFRVHRHHVILALELHAVASVVEKQGVGSFAVPRELRHHLIHLALVDIDFQRHVEPDRLQRLGDVRGVVRRIGKGGSVLVGAVADDERNALVGVARRRESMAKQKTSDKRCCVFMWRSPGGHTCNLSPPPLNASPSRYFCPVSFHGRACCTNAAPARSPWNFR